MSEKVVIIGSGPAGWTAATYAARANLRPLLFEGAVTEENRGQNTLPLGQLNLTTEVENWPAAPPGDTRAYLKSALPSDSQPYWVQADRKQPGHGFNGPEIMELLRKQAVGFGTRVVTDDIIRVDFSCRPFHLHSRENGTVEALTVIVATGARANYVGLPSEARYKNHGVSACAVCDGALPRYRNKPVVVVGGGDSALEEATYLTAFASQVYLVHRRDTFRASGVMQERVRRNLKIELRLNRTVEEVLGGDPETVGVTGVRLRTTTDGAVEDVAAVGLFSAIGHTPNTAFLGGQLETTGKGSIVRTVPHRTHTSVAGVFAAGDVADDYYRQACAASASGCMAALDAERYLAVEGEHTPTCSLYPPCGNSPTAPATIRSVIE